MTGGWPSARRPWPGTPRRLARGRLKGVGALPPDGAEREPAEDLAAAALTMARRFAAGATMWCVAPQWPSHGHHVAVEFVHPVIVGKRALPAISVDGAEAQNAVRLLSRP